MIAMKLRLALRVCTIAACAVLPVIMAQEHVDTPGQLATSLHEGLIKLNLSSAAALAINASQYLLPKLLTPYPQTILVPTNDAIEAAASKLQGLNGSTLGAILSYHIVNGTLSYKQLPDQFDYHVVGLTQLNDSLYTNLPRNQTQAVVVKRMDPKMGIEIVEPTSTDIYFNLNTDGPQLGPLLLQPINGVLIPPVNVTSTIEKIANLSSLAKTIKGQQLAAIVDSLRGVTVFAPVNNAFKDVTSMLQSAQPQQISAILSNHILNGTVLYAPQMPRTALENNDETTNKTRCVTSAGGIKLKLSWSTESNCVQITAPSTDGKSNITANIVRTDTLTSNGVIHYIDKIILNSQTNTTAANEVAGNDQAAQNIVKQEAPNLSANAAAGGRKNATNKASVLVTPSSSDCIVVISSLAAALALLI